MIANIQHSAILLAAMGMDVWDLILSAGIFVTMFLLVIGLFGHRGKVQLSPQREAAIATGHTDRKTIFESQYVGPAMWVLLTVAHRMAVPKVKDWLRGQIVAAGSPNYYTAEEYMALSLGFGLTMGMIMVVFQWFFTLQLGAVAFLLFAIGILLGVAMMMFQIYSKAADRLRAISRRVPYSLDLVSLAMGAGATFTEAVRTIVREQTDDPFNVELKTLLAEMDLGTTRKKALQNLADRVPLESLRSIMASVIQAEELGSPLGDVLHDQSTLMRLQRTVRAENLAAVASVRILIPCLLLVMAVILTVFGPAIVRFSHGGLF